MFQQGDNQKQLTHGLVHATREKSDPRLALKSDCGKPGIGGFFAGMNLRSCARRSPLQFVLAIISMMSCAASASTRVYVPEVSHEDRPRGMNPATGATVGMAPEGMVHDKQPIQTPPAVMEASEDGGASLAPPNQSASSKVLPLQLTPEVQIELLQNGYGSLLGIAGVSIHGTPLRSSAHPMLVRLDTPGGILYSRLKLDGIQYGDDGAVRVQLRAIGLPWGRGEFLDNYRQPLLGLKSPNEPVVDDLALILRPAHLSLGGRSWTGVSYSFEFKSQSRAVHRLLTLATWEIAGSIRGNTVLSQGQVNRPVFRGGQDLMFTTACLHSSDQYGSPQGYSFQLAPRGGLIQAFDFQYAPQGALLQFWPEFDTVSSLVESPPGSDVLHVIDEYRFALTNRVTTTPKWVLFTPGSLAPHEARDLWWAAYEYVGELIRRPFGIAPTRVVPEIGLRYGTRMEGGRLRMSIAGQEVNSTQAPDAIAERVLPRLAEQGIRRFFPEVMSRSDVTEDGMRRKMDEGIQGDLCCASVCATRRFLPSDFWGGLSGWKRMAGRGRELGIEIGACFAPHFSPRAAIFEEHPEYRMIDSAGLPAGGGYGFQRLVVADWNSGIRDWVFEDLKRWKEEGGLDYLFTDSFSSMGLVQENYAAGMRCNFKALGRLYGELQRIGIKSFSFECVSPFGVGRFGTADLRGDRMDANKAVAGQNDFGWWVGEEDMAFNQCLRVAPRKRTPDQLEQIEFRAMANRGFVMYETLVSDNHELPAWWARLNRVYNQALPQMQTRHLLPDGAGVSWEGNDIAVVWTFRETTITLPSNQRVERLDSDGAPAMDRKAGQIILPAWGVYRVSK